VYPERMAANLESLGGVVQSGNVLMALVKAGISREDGYRIVQRNAMDTWAGGKGFRENLAADPEVAGRVDPAELDAAMEARRHLEQVDALFTRVFGEPGPAS